MNYGNCAVCGKMTAYNGVRICSNCKEEQFLRIKEYLNENGKTNIRVISSDLGLPKKLLFEYVVDGRLDALDIGKEDFDKALEDDRRSRLSNMLDNSVPQNNNKPKKEIDRESPKMRFLGR